MAARLDLKWSLALRAAAVALLCLFISAGLVLRQTYHDVRQANRDAAGIVAQELQTQLFRIGSGIDLSAHFPDWDRVAGMLQSPGQCVQFIRPDFSVARSNCIGFAPGAGAAPAWFGTLCGLLFATPTDIALPVADHGTQYGSVFVTIAPGAVLATVWQETRRLLGLTALLVAAICVLQFVAIGRALRPTREILAGLDRLAHGDLACRLPSFRLRELQRISTVFNQLAANLQHTLQQRMELAARLAEGHEQERLALARELHDELAQNVSAIGALAASIQTTARAEYPALEREVTRLGETALAVMRSLRTTLGTLRPPEIDDFGLAHSLGALVQEQQRRAGGALTIRLEVEGDLDALPPTEATHVYRVVQEALTNIGKHADARQARVTLHLPPAALPGMKPAPRRLALMIEDDGDAATDQDMNATGGGLGLIGMRERVMALGGELHTTRLKQRGFRVHASIPVTPAPPA